MAFGTPYKKENIEPYYAHFQNLKNRYKAIDGISPFAKITEAQAYSLEKSLHDMQDEYEFKVFKTYDANAIQEIANDGIKEAVSIVLAPHYSTFSVTSYNGRAKEEADGSTNSPGNFNVCQWKMK